MGRPCNSTPRVAARVYARAVTGSPENLADTEFARLCSLLETQGLHSGRCRFADVWAAVRQWVLTGSGEAVRDEFLLGFECNWNPNDNGDRAYPVPPEGVPDGPLFDIGFFWDFSRGGETGVELWYAADGDWKPVTDDPDFDIDHPVSYHIWGYAGPRAAGFIDAVESTPGVHVAARKSPVLVRVFQTGKPDLIVRCSP